MWAMSGDLEPFYENTVRIRCWSGARPRFVKLRAPASDGGEWSFEREGVAGGVSINNRRRSSLILPTIPRESCSRGAELELIRDLCVEFRCARDHRRDLRTHLCLMGRNIFDAVARRNAGADGDDQWNVETYSVDGMARGMGGGPEKITNAIRKCTIFDGGSAGAAAGGGRGGVEFAGGILCEAGGGIPGAAGSF